MYNAMIIDKMQVDREIALRLEHGVNGVGKEALKQAGLIYKGWERLTWYSSCLTGDYQDVCANLKEEDARFAKQLASLIAKRDVIYDMVEIYVNQILQTFTLERITNIERLLLKAGANFSTSVLTNHAFSGAITAAISYSLGMNMAVENRLNKIAGFAVFLMGAYGRVQLAVEAANQLKEYNGIYYQGLYKANLEMFYFLIEPVIQRNENLNFLWLSDEELASAIIRLVG